ncbi:hypothetical protein [Streptomyces sp. SID9727]|uniref:hypothetical protein n=1 Tax=Streptomyces sp. SID9727 TaxID=2706114 RepID=UPI0013CCA0A2|nr:hypothetical protein [Streptomyces sp. SID9727]NEC66305.1 hypothetical protein [Streptomyces sp. SID9727]
MSQHAHEPHSGESPVETARHYYRLVGEGDMSETPQLFDAAAHHHRPGYENSRACGVDALLS